MSAIGGIYNADRAPIDEGLLQRMSDIVDYRGPDGSGIWFSQNVGLVHRLLKTTEESAQEKQPLSNGRGLSITAHSRIDNREELEKKFLSRGLFPGFSTARDASLLPDVAYILAAYELWEEEAPNYLLGDFAFAIWDARNQKLFAARDPLGVKPFVYFWNGRRFLFGSEMKQIFQDSAVPREINLAYLGDFLTMCYAKKDESPFLAVRRLPPGHLLSLKGTQLEIKRYFHWDPDSEPLSRASFEDNARTFLDIFQKAVRARCRVPPGYRVGSLLSGGLDSSSIVSCAAREPSFPVFTLTFPEANPSYMFKQMDPPDESPYSNALIQRYGLEPHSIEIKGWGPFENLEQNLWHQETPLFFPNLAYFGYLFDKVGDSGIRVLLHGEGGDEVFYPGPQCLFEELKRGNWPKFFKECAASKKVWGTSYGTQLLRLLRSLAPDSVRTFYRHHLKKVVPSWINPAFAKRFHLRERIEEDFYYDPKANRSSSYGILLWLYRDITPTYLETFDRACLAKELEVRLPFLDLRVFRFLATIPWDQKKRKAISKLLLREALKDLLPPLIRDRPRKTEFTPVVRTMLEKYALAFIRETFESPHPLLRSMILPERVRSLFTRYFYSKPPHRPFATPQSHWYLWYLTSVNQWLKHSANFFIKLKEVSREGPKSLVATTGES